VAAAVLERLGLNAAFEVLIDRDQVARLKPSPEGLLAACHAFDVPPHAAAYVGDTVADIEAATSAGLRAWGIGTGLGTPEELRAAGATAVFATLDGVLARLTEELTPTTRQTR
jgi:phosphoglycolate phosphatase-like HAD superfamily hydrolase